MRIKAAGAEDLAAIAALEERCFPDPWQPEVIERLLSRFTLVLEEDTLAGYLVMSHVLDEGSIDNIAVAPEYRRRGAADALVADAEERARRLGLATLTLEVRASNAPAIALYEKHGFCAVGRRKNYYDRPREDAVLMTEALC